MTDFACAAIFSAHCDTIIARQRVYDIYDAISYSTEQTAPSKVASSSLPSNNELSAAKAHSRTPLSTETSLNNDHILITMMILMNINDDGVV